jgi:hypothetical protein
VLLLVCDRGGKEVSGCGTTNSMMQKQKFPTGNSLFLGEICLRSFVVVGSKKFNVSKLTHRAELQNFAIRA